MIHYKKGSLFNEETEGKYKAHATNSAGVWGSGIAVEFKKRFPASYKEYNAYCKNEDIYVPGTSLITTEKVVCLHTSRGFGDAVDSPVSIVGNTLLALDNLLEHLPRGEIEIHSNKFNSGLFSVPWEYTEAALNMFVKEFPDIKWTVWVVD